MWGLVGRDGGRLPVRRVGYVTPVFAVTQSFQVLHVDLHVRR